MPRPCSRITDPVGYIEFKRVIRPAQRNLPRVSFFCMISRCSAYHQLKRKKITSAHTHWFSCSYLQDSLPIIIEQGKGLDYSIFSLIDQGRQNEEFTDQTFKISVRCAWIYNMIQYITASKAMTHIAQCTEVRALQAWFAVTKIPVPEGTLLY